MWTTKIADLLPIVILNKKCDQRKRSRIVPPPKKASSRILRVGGICFNLFFVLM